MIKIYIVRIINHTKSNHAWRIDVELKSVTHLVTCIIVATSFVVLISWLESQCSLTKTVENLSSTCFL